MRRADRAVTDPARIRAIIEACDCCRLGLNDDGHVYIVPVSFGFTAEDGRYTLYFHSAPEGRKIDILKKDPEAAFEMDTGYALRGADTACGHSAAFRSVMGRGTVRFAETAEEKRLWLGYLMEHVTGRSGWEMPDAACEKVCAFRLDVSELSCKEHE